MDKLFFLDRGLSLPHIAVLLACWGAFGVVFQVPAGALSDRWDRRRMLVLAGVFHSLCYLVWFFSSSLWLFLLGFLIRTVGSAFVSGNLQAYVFEFLQANGREGDFEKVWGRGSALERIGLAVALLLGGFLSTYSYDLVVGLSALSPAVIIGVALALPRSVRRRKPTVHAERSYLSLIKGGARQSVMHPVFVRAFLYFAIIAIVPGLTEEYDQVLMSRWLSLPNSVIGIWLALGVAAGSLGAFLAYRVRHVQWRVVNGTAVLVGAILLTVPFSRSLGFLGALFLFNGFGGLTSVLVQGMVQREIRTEERATITSVIEAGTEVSGIVMGLAFAFVAGAFGVQVAYGGCALIVGGYLLALMVVRRKGPPKAS